MYVGAVGSGSVDPLGQARLFRFEPSFISILFCSIMCFFGYLQAVMLSAAGIIRHVFVFFICFQDIIVSTQQSDKPTSVTCSWGKIRYELCPASVFNLHLTNKKGRKGEDEGNTPVSIDSFFAP